MFQSIKAGQVLTYNPRGRIRKRFQKMNNTYFGKQMVTKLSKQKPTRHEASQMKNPKEVDTKQAQNAWV